MTLYPSCRRVRPDVSVCQSLLLCERKQVGLFAICGHSQLLLAGTAMSAAVDPLLKDMD